MFHKHNVLNCPIVFSNNLACIDVLHDLCFTDNWYILYVRLLLDNRRRIEGLSVCKNYRFCRSLKISVIEWMVVSWTIISPILCLSCNHFGKILIQNGRIKVLAVHRCFKELCIAGEEGGRGVLFTIK